MRDQDAHLRRDLQHGLLACEAMNQLGNLAGGDAFQLQTELAAALPFDFNDATRRSTRSRRQQFHESRRRRHRRAFSSRCTSA